MQLADHTAATRRAMAFLVAKRAGGSEALNRDGYAVLPDFLPEPLFQRVSAEAEAAIAVSRETHPNSATGAAVSGLTGIS